MRDNWIRSYYAERTAQRVVLVFAALVAGAPAALAQGRAPVPDDAALSKAQGLLREVYGKEYDEAETSAQKTALAKKMLAQAMKTKGDPASHYVLLRVAKDVAVLAADAETAREAVDRIVEAFEVDPIQTKVDCLEAVARTAKSSSQHAALAEQAFSLVDVAAAEDDFEAAGKLGGIARDSASRARDYSLVKQIVARMKAVKESEEVYAEYQKAMARLEDNPTDPDANLSAGRYLCLVKGDWEKGVAMLALGSDRELRAVARKELEDAPTGEAQVQLADAWWNLAKAREGPDKNAFLLRAGTWYRLARSRLTSGLAKSKVEKRLEEVRQIARANDASVRPASRLRPPTQIGEIGRFQGHTGSVLCVAFSPDGRLALSGGDDTTVRLWDVATTRELRSFSGHTGKVRSVCFCPKGDRFVSGSVDRSIRLWDLHSGDEIRRFDGHTAAVQRVQAAWPDGEHLVSCGDEGVVRVWETETANQLREFSVVRGGRRTRLRDFSRNGRVAISSGLENTVRLWDVESGREVTFDGRCHTYVAALSADGTWALTGGSDTHVRLWDVSTRKELRRLAGHTAHVYYLAFSPDGRRALSCDAERTVYLWDLVRGQGLVLFRQDASLAGPMVISPDGRRALCGSTDGTVRMWGLPN